MRSVRWSALVAIYLLCGLSADAGAEDELVYVKCDTREATRAASLEASGVVTFDAPWHVIGPFRNRGLAAPHPPETEINLAAEYDGFRQKVRWQEQAFPDGEVHSLDLWNRADRAVCYLYRCIDMESPRQVRVGMGSDDGVRLWLNGKLLLDVDTGRAAAPDQEFVTLDLRAGRNDLLMKVANQNGDWAFYFAPTVSERVMARLARELDRDFPPEGEAAHYSVEALPMPEGEAIEVGGLAWRPDGKLLVGTRRGDVFIVDNALSDNPDQIRFRPYLRGLHEITGMTLVGENDLYLVQRPEVTLVRDTNGDDEADEFTTINDTFGCSGDYHEYIFGPARDRDGNFFVTLNVGFGGGHQAKVPYRGFCLKITSDGELIPWAFGLRSPNGVNFAPDGRLYYCDNQGEWVAACKMHEVRQGEYYGHAASVRWWPGLKDGDQPEMTWPAIWFPYEMQKSTSEPIWDTTGGKFGPFTGQCFVGDQNNSLLSRVVLEEVNGRMQGACFYFRVGFQSGINRLVFAPDGTMFAGETNRGWGSVGGRPFGIERVRYTGKLPFEIQNMQITPSGWRLTLTEPVDAVLAADRANYFVESYTYHHWDTYGSPEIDRREHPVSAIKVAPDGRSVEFTVGARQTKRVFHVKLSNFRSSEQNELLHPDAYYTVRELPDSGG